MGETIIPDDSKRLALSTRRRPATAGRDEDARTQELGAGPHNLGFRSNKPTHRLPLSPVRS